MKIQRFLEVQIPLTPNFITIGEKECVPIGQFSEQELREIGELWIEELIKKAKKKK